MDMEVSMMYESLNKYMFPIEEAKVLYNTTNDTPRNTKDYKAIIRQDNGKLISIMKDTYKVVKNEEVIKPLLEELNELDSRWYIDNSHSYVSNSRMRLQVTFPDLTFYDGRSDIALSLFIHNSYNGDEGVRMFYGAIRGICSNGMVFGQIMAQYYRKHTKGLIISNIKDQIESSYASIPVIKERVEILQSLKVNDSIREKAGKAFGKTILKHVDEQDPAQNQWIYYNYFTWYISHLIDKRMRAGYQLILSKLFNL